jgi:hypothetical protein
VIDHDRVVRVANRDRPQEQRIEDAEDRGIDANPDRQRKDGNGDDAGVFGERPEAVAKVLGERVDHC